MSSLPSALWLSSGLTLTVCGSAVILSIQRGLQHKKTQPTEETASASASKLRFDDKRDLQVPFADNDRLPRMTFDTIVMTAMAVYNLYTTVREFTHLEQHTQAAIATVIAYTLMLASWLYALALVCLSGRYKLPNEWGWKLNVHLCVFYFVAWCMSLYAAWEVFTKYSFVSWEGGLPLLIAVVANSDLLYTTATVERGQPFLDENGKPVSAVNVSSIWSTLYFNWVTPLIKTAYRKKSLVDDDLPTLPPLYRGYNLYYIFGEHRNRSLLYRIYQANRSAILIQVTLAFITSLLYYVPAYFLNQLLVLIQHIQGGMDNREMLTQGFLVVGGLGLSIFVTGIFVGQLWYYAASSVQVRIKSMLNIEIYRKTLHRMDSAVAGGGEEKDESSNAETTEASESTEDVSSSTGTIVNLMSTDSNRISEFSTWWMSVICAPTELAIGIYFLYQLLGLSCFLGLLVMIVTLPLNHYNAKLFAKTQDQLMESRDKRVALMNEVLQGIRQIKFFAWERNWEKRIMEARGLELKHLRTSYISEVLFTILWQGSPILVTIISFWSFTKLEGKELTAPIAFTAITVFTELRFALNILPEVFIEWLQALISVRRIETYLNEEEVTAPVPINPNEPVHIGFDHATIGWKLPALTDASEETRATGPTDGFILKDVDIHFPNSELSVICGATGSGKTLMILSLLGEATILSGQVHCPRTPVATAVSADFAICDEIPEEAWILDHAVAYVSQTAWLQNASIRDNILFGLPMVEQRYKDTLTACALDKDLTILEDGDMTEIGEKGITLSGGQKARVALARAVYSRAKNVLMDDVLSAVDAHTAKHLYDTCLMGPLMRNRTRILITHHVKLCLGGTAYLVHIQSGQVNLFGSPSDLRQSGSLATILEEEKGQEEAEDEEEAIEEATAPAIEVTKVDLNKKAPKVLVEEETRATGKVKFRLYKLYLNMVGNPFYWFMMALFIIGARGLDIMDSWWIKEWAQSYENQDRSASATAFHMFNMSPQRSANSYGGLYMPMTDSNGSADIAAMGTDPSMTVMGDGSKTDSVNFYLGVYVLITMSNILVGTVRFAGLYWGTLRASKKLYAQLLHRVFRAPLRFFDTTPIGRILNRFSKDFETVDSTIPNDLLNFVIQWLVIFSSILSVSIVMPVFIVPMVLIAVVNIALGAMFVSTSRELKRMDSVSRSPLFSHFTETIVGVATIRAFGATRQFLQEMLKRVDTNARPFYYVWVINRWVSLRYALMGATINSVTGLIILLSLSRLNTSLAGFILSFVLQYTDQMFWAIRRYTSLEMSFNAVERVVEFMEMEQEAPAITDVRPPAAWPAEGSIEVQDLEVRYAADLDPVLRGLSFSINPREKIGVVGRTGSGKSTLALSFFRFVEATKGRILIDNIDIKHLGTEDLRANLTIIPQDPTLFSGTLRSNMDPFDQFTDEDIFMALRRVHLLPTGNAVDEVELSGVNSNVFKDLDTPVSEGGKNFSQGQRQLLCLARALLKRTRIVLMDEATASVDFDTDKAIQKTIATEFADCTILCIAHRLHTVIEYDRILVLDQGKIVEFASPLELIKNVESVFFRMCKNSGEFDSLLALAKAKHQLVDV
ncbi:P-loop containing nucleoside triphosphate hydrolase protein [Radiomyces spectabilis]|uniref:P-loop containing nucleoside triphosphate hydrolase protein n=1 Tax=Radiomyces spectabilis TaxID=64574 RepID=UPI00221FB707|nr:P-loop containing nucleoside triphosphate hydrolase protein [Radiomyces spectabilis]KAI8379596.1 P-loop containing nucleoside triphosphate hydrolase protein [Radiomyces spectabilis]